MYSLYKSLFRLPIDNEIENWSPAQVLQDKPVESSTKTTNMQCGSCGEAIDVYFNIGFRTKKKYF